MIEIVDPCILLLRLLWLCNSGSSNDESWGRASKNWLVVVVGDLIRNSSCYSGCDETSKTDDHTETYHAQKGHCSKESRFAWLETLSLSLCSVAREINSSGVWANNSLKENSLKEKASSLFDRVQTRLVYETGFLMCGDADFFCFVLWDASSVKSFSPPTGRLSAIRCHSVALDQSKQ